MISNKKKSFISFNLPDKVFGIEKYFLTLFLLPLGLIVVFLISLNLIFLPQISNIGTINKQIKTVDESTDKITLQNKYLESIDQEELQRNSEYLNNAVLKNKKSYLLVGIIREVANKFDYQINSFSLIPGELKDSDVGQKTSSSSELRDMVRMPLTLNLSGPQGKSLDLILALEKTLPILFIDRYETKTSESVTQLALTVYSYYISDDTEIDTSNISLDDLILSEEESALVEKISTFTKIEENQTNIGTTQFQQYQRENPFSL